jgi:hypothetical protein
VKNLISRASTQGSYGFFPSWSTARITAALLVCFCALQSSQILARTTSTTIPATPGVIDFGSFAVLPGCANCSVTISATGVRTASGAIVLTSASTGSVAKFSVTQTCSGGGCTVYTASGVANASLPAGGVAMTLGSFTFAQGTVVAKVNTLSVGATLTIPRQGSAGTFSGGAFTVTTTP